MKIETREYETEDGGHPFSKWFNKLSTPAALKVRTAVARLESGNTSNVKSVGEGVSEIRINFGPGYRVYFGMDGETLVILLGGGSKQRQSKAIDSAKLLWKEYKKRKRKEQNDGPEQRLQRDDKGTGRK